MKKFNIFKPELLNEREREREEEEEEEEQGPKPYTDRIYQRPEEDCKISD